MLSPNSENLHPRKFPVCIPIEFILEGIFEGTKWNPVYCCFAQALTIYDIEDVYKKLHTASPRWFDLGLALGLSHFILTNIDSERRGDNVLCFREMLAELLSTQYVTWSLLSDALKNPTVNLINLADSITGNYFQCLCIWPRVCFSGIRTLNVILGMSFFFAFSHNSDQSVTNLSNTVTTSPTFR